MAVRKRINLKKLEVQTIIAHYIEVRIKNLTNYKNKTEYEYSELVGRYKELQNMMDYFKSVGDITLVDKNIEEVSSLQENNG